MECPICGLGDGFKADGSVTKGSCKNCGALEITDIAQVSTLTDSTRQLLSRYLKAHPRKEPVLLNLTKSKMLIEKAEEWDAAQRL